MRMLRERVVLIISVPVFITACGLGALIALAAKLGALRTVRSRRVLATILRGIPTSRFWRNRQRGRRQRERPFAVSLRATDPATFIGLNKAEISAVLGRDVISIDMMDHGDHHATWSNYSTMEVACYFRGNMQNTACVDARFSVRERGGQWKVIAQAPWRR